MMVQTFPGWHYDHDRLALDLFNIEGHWIYEVDLERCRTSAEVLDWIFQVAGKTWCTDKILGGLIHMLDKILHPQATLCSFGRERGPINAAALLSGKHQ